MMIVGFFLIRTLVKGKFNLGALFLRNRGSGQKCAVVSYSGQTDVCFVLVAIRCHDCTGDNCPLDIVNKWSGKCHSKMGKCFIRKDPNGGK